MILSNRHRHRRAVFLTTVLFLLAVWFFLTTTVPVTPRAPSAEVLARDFPLAWKHIHSSSVRGGAWYIPPEWGHGDTRPATILDAARLASDAALVNGDRQIDLSNVPLIVHQTLRSTQIDTWKPEIVPWVEQWLNLSADSRRPMTYFFWDDDGIFDFMEKFEPDFLADFLALFSPVERADIFRVLVCARFGGVYADVDTEPLRHPAKWIRSDDVARWNGSITGKSYGSDTLDMNDRPVNLIWGLEADTDPDTDTYWRMGYTYPVQLTQWALASAPRHAVIDQFMENLKGQIREQPSVRADPLTRTGPAAVTKATQMWLEKTSDIRWNALTGLQDGGRSKLVKDVMVFPITGFSPGRGRYGNMGSKPVTHPDARLVHHALGSWRRFDIVVEYGKFCRSSFGLCREWSKVPS